ncbi:MULTISPECIES: metal-dependent transcriptional regulator [Desertihabitans]|uniref:Metal-dependent transcriptional regulator n=1 Tax=Desertihabitans brevis TaxID=2268447 RepID=A0A367YY65_9ACTN|nr:MULTISPECIES: metal-dependent transcriptional regulator [Desertihabitans]RCK70826.1 metal-dependent transcriptional regulator [Desertihabitans brevis]
MSELIDTTEMYLRTIYELEEEGITPLRARIAERLHHSGPTVSQTVARMERDGLVRVHGDRHLELTPEGQDLAMRVMRKHRLCERLLTDVIGLDWELVHDEACRWEHVVSEHVERRLVDLLHAPEESPYGNPIPGLSELGVEGPETDFRAGTEMLSDVVRSAGQGETPVVIKRMSENLQSDVEFLATLRAGGVQPGVRVLVSAGGLGVRVVPAEQPGCELDLETASHLFVARAG